MDLKWSVMGTVCEFKYYQDRKSNVHVLLNYAYVCKRKLLTCKEKIFRFVKNSHIREIVQSASRSAVILLPLSE